MIIKGKAVFKCLKTGEEVSLSKDCVECDWFEWWSWEDAHPTLNCKFVPHDRYRKDVVQGGETVREEEDSETEEGEEEESEE